MSEFVFVLKNDQTGDLLGVVNDQDVADQWQAAKPIERDYVAFELNNLSMAGGEFKPVMIPKSTEQLKMEVIKQTQENQKLVKELEELRDMVQEKLKARTSSLSERAFAVRVARKVQKIAAEIPEGFDPEPEEVSESGHNWDLVDSLHEESKTRQRYKNWQTKQQTPLPSSNVVDRLLAACAPNTKETKHSLYDLGEQVKSGLQLTPEQRAKCSELLPYQPSTEKPSVYVQDSYYSREVDEETSPISSAEYYVHFNGFPRWESVAAYQVVTPDHQKQIRAEMTNAIKVWLTELESVLSKPNMNFGKLTLDAKGILKFAASIAPQEYQKIQRFVNQKIGEFYRWANDEGRKLVNANQDSKSQRAQMQELGKMTARALGQILSDPEDF